MSIIFRVASGKKEVAERREKLSGISSFDRLHGRTSGRRRFAFLASGWYNVPRVGIHPFTRYELLHSQEHR